MLMSGSWSSTNREFQTDGSSWHDLFGAVPINFLTSSTVTAVHVLRLGVTSYGTFVYRRGGSRRTNWVDLILKESSTIFSSIWTHGSPSESSPRTPDSARQSLSCSLDLVFWQWTFVVCRLCHGKTLYQIWAKFGNPRRSYYTLNIWLYDLEHLSLVALYSGIVYTKFKLTQPVRYAVNLNFDHVTLTFDLWPFTLNMYVLRYFAQSLKSVL